MAIINPDGLFHGERLARCSDEAQLHWVRLFTASNTFGRLELSYRHIVNFAYSSFHKIPTEEQLSGWIEEYFHNYLLFVYDAKDGSTWGQWLTSSEYLSRYHTASDRRSPVPNEKELESYRREYLKSKSGKSLRINRNSKLFSDTSNHTDQNEPSPDYNEISQEEIDTEVECFAKHFEINDISEPLSTIHGDVLGIGIGIGEGKGKNKNSSAKDKPSRGKKTAEIKTRHEEFKVVIGKYWQSKNPDVEMPWGPAEGRNLAMWLKESPTTTVDQFTLWLRNRFRSDVNHTDRPSRWIGNVTKFAKGPVDQYGNLKNGNGGIYAAISSGKTDSNMAILQELIAEDEHRSRSYENGFVQTSETEQDGCATLLLDSGASGHESVSSGDVLSF
jgi:hypothetical protein